MKKLVVCCAFASLLPLAHAADADVKTVQGDVVTTITLTNAQTVTSTSIKTGDELPSSVPTPVFHLDASDTTSWEFETKDGKQYVTKIPSKVGDRYLTRTQPTLPTMWAIQSGPEYVADVAALNGKAMIDFGNQGSRMGLVFDPDTNHASSNGLFNIGSVVAIYGSERGGGFVLGGGWGYNNGFGYFAQRGADPATGSDNKYTVESPLFGWHANPIARDGACWLDGFKIAPRSAGLSGKWQTLSLVFSSETGSANGLGINDTRNADRSGGQQIAEMIFFGEKLTDDQRIAVEAYLMKKWFGRTRMGSNARAELGELSVRNSAGSPTADFVTAEIPEGETLTARKVTGGYRGGAITKTGAGTLVMGNASDYTGAIKVQEGTLRFTQYAYSEALPANSFLHLDASLEDTLTLVDGENGTKLVTEWRDVEGRSFKNVALKMLQSDTTVCPVYYADPLLEGKNVVDFGAFAENGKFMGAAVNLSGVATAFLVIGAQEGGGHLIGASSADYQRASLEGLSIDAGLWKKYTEQWTLTADNCSAFIDGVAVDQFGGIPHRGWHVIALRIPGAQVNYLARVADIAKRGGQRLAEVVLYNRVLTEDEFNGAQAYLMQKWIPRLRSGARVTAHTVEMAKDTAIETEGDAIVRNLTVAGNGTLTKRGVGTLSVEEASLSDLVVEGGSVEARPSVDVVDGPAVNPVFHLDAAKLNTMILSEVNGTNFVRQWHDVAGLNVAGGYSSSESSLPWLVSANDADANGNPVLNFGKYNSGRYFVFDRAVDTVRSAYVLIGTQDDHGGFILGSHSGRGSTARMDFHRNTSNNGILLWNDNTVKNISKIYLDGDVVSAPTSTGLKDNAYQLVEFHIESGAHVSALAHDRDIADRSGGQRLGEVILYDRELTEREKVATRNYLMKKWLNKEPQELPAEEKPKFYLHTATFDGESGLHVDTPVEFATVTGSGSFTKDGTNVLTVADMSGYSGTVNVESGTLALTGSMLADYPRDAVFHVDATRGLTCETNNGVISVTRWQNLATVGDYTSWSAQPVVNNPELLESELNWLPIVDMGTCSSKKHMRFKVENGENGYMKNIRSVFWVIGSQNGGGFLLGGGTATPDDGKTSNDGYLFHRGGSGGSSYSDALLNNPHSGEVARSAKWRLNGSDVSPTSTGLSGGYDVLSMVVSSESKSVEAEGFAFDGRDSQENRKGGQRLAEVLIYDRKLSDAERLQVETYLQQKWGFAPYRVSNESQADFTVAEGATLALGGTSQPVKSVSGNGTISDGTLEVQGNISAGTDAVTPGVLTVDGDLTFGANSVWTIDLAADAADKIIVNGTCTFANPQKVALNNMDAAFSQQEYEQVVMEAEAFANKEALMTPEFVNEMPQGKNMRFVVRDNQVVLRMSKLGFIIIVR